MTSDFRIGSWTIRPGLNTISQNGTSTRVEPKVMEVLVCLASRPGEMVPKETILRTVWPETFVTDDVVIRSISELRRVFEDDPREARFIETIPKRGYRLLATVTPLAEDKSNAAGAAQSNPARRNGRLLWLTMAGLLLACAVLVGFSVDHLRGDIFGRNPRIHSLAVLPLKNLSDDPTQEYFTYGMTEELITQLAQVSGLKVISHTSVIEYAKSTKPLPQIARELGVDGIVEGSVQRSGGRVRITAQLIYAPVEQHLWAASYDGDLRDALTLESSVAAAIVEPIRARAASMPASPKPPHSPSLQAIEDYLQADYSLERMGAGDGYEGYKAAIQYLKQAISDDPDFAPAYYKLAVTYDAQFALRQKDSMPLEKAALAKALELNPEFTDARAMSASIRMGYDCDFRGIEKELREGLRINPNSVEAHSALSAYLGYVDRPDESIREAQLAQELDPEGYHEVGFLMSNGEYDLAIDKLRRHLELHPNDGFTYIDNGLIKAYHFAGRYRESIEAIETAWTLFGFKEIGRGAGRAYAASGYAGALRYSATQLERLYAAGEVYKPDYIASWYARAGDKDQSLQWIAITLADNNYCWLGLDGDPDFASLRSDSRFQEMVKRATRH